MNSEQLFTEVEVNILGFSPTLRWIITLGYNKPVNQWSKKLHNLCIFMPYFEIVNKLGGWQLFRVNVTISASLVKLRRGVIFRNKTLPWKTPKPQFFFAFFFLIEMAYLFNSEIWASLKLSRNQNAMLLLPNQSARKTLFTGLVYANGRIFTSMRSMEVNILNGNIHPRLKRIIVLAYTNLVTTRHIQEK